MTLSRATRAGRIVVALRSSKHPAFLVFAPTEIALLGGHGGATSLPHTAQSAELDPARLDEPDTMQSFELSGHLA